MPDQRPFPPVVWPRHLRLSKCGWVLSPHAVESIGAPFGLGGGWQLRARSVRSPLFRPFTLPCHG